MTIFIVDSSTCTISTPVVGKHHKHIPGVCQAALPSDRREIRGPTCITALFCDSSLTPPAARQQERSDHSLQVPLISAAPHVNGLANELAPRYICNWSEGMTQVCKSDNTVHCWQPTPTAASTYTVSFEPRRIWRRCVLANLSTAAAGACSKRNHPCSRHNCSP